ncbi:MAG: hypothetical protein J0H09_07810 [Burkholderiales bacterium]|nr:hypothetical protein [Burkholderiales bacterium]ODU62861.1 MAG: hypothetical protein ABT05_06880 [Lautropia sp. SCN 66-9]
MRKPQILVVDDFLDNPDAVRAIALQQRFVKMHSAGVRTEASFLHLAPYKTSFERLLNRPLSNWDDNAANGRFQCCFASDAIPYHSDSQSYAGVLFLTPDAPAEAGLSFFRGRLGGLRRRSPDAERMMLTFGGGAEFDRSRWEELDRVANFYNRLVLFDAHLAHGASAYFGDRIENARLFQNFFFNVD